MSDRPASRRAIDLSHEIVDGMVTHPGIPGPTISTFLTHEASAARYAPGTTFEIGRIDLVANTGTYLDTPAHRFAGRADLSDLDLATVVDLDAVLVDVRGRDARAIEPDVFAGIQVAGRAVLVATGWDRHWGTDAYLSDNPFLTEAAARHLVAAGAALIGIDSLNVDSLADPRRPAHTVILDAGIPLVEHLTGLDGLPPDGFRFFAVPRASGGWRPSRCGPSRSSATDRGPPPEYRRGLAAVRPGVMNQRLDRHDIQPYGCINGRDLRCRHRLRRAGRCHAA